MNLAKPMQQSNGKILPVLLLVLGLVVAMVAAVTLDAPISGHANTAHVGQVWSAVNIQKVISAGRCSPVYVYVCPAQDYYRVFCQAPGSSQWIGMLVGATDVRVITAFPARENYWRRAAERDGCIQVALP